MLTITHELLETLDRDRPGCRAKAALEYGSSKGEVYRDPARLLWHLSGETEAWFRSILGENPPKPKKEPIRCGHCGRIGERELGTAWCKECAPIFKAQWEEYRAAHYEGYRAATATPKLSQPTRAPKPAPPPPKPKHRVIYGGGRVIVLPDEPEEPKK